MRSSGKGGDPFKDLHCSYCALRFGIADTTSLERESHFTTVATKKLKYEEEIAYEPSTKESDTSIGRD